MPVIKDLIEAAAVKIAGFRRCRLGSHLKTPAFGGPAPRSRHFTMLREDQESRSLNDLWVVQGRLLRPGCGRNLRGRGRPCAARSVGFAPGAVPADQVAWPTSAAQDAWLDVAPPRRS